MKKILSCISLLILIMCLTSCGSTQNSSGNTDPLPEQISEYVSNAPGVSAEMNTADYWISKYDDSDNILMDTDQINEINLKNEPTLSVGKNKEIALSEIREKTDGKYVSTLLDEYTVPDDPSAYFADGKSTSSDYFKKLTDNMDKGAVAENVSVKFGFTTERTDLKAAPTSDFISDSSQDLHYDMNAVAECAPYEPVAILHESKDSEWLFIVSYGYAGWGDADNFCICDSREDWISRQDPDDFLIVTDREIRLAYDPYEPESSGLLIPMGTKLTLVKPEDAPEDFNGRACYNSYIAKVPGRYDNGKLKDIYTLIPVSDDVSIGYMPYTRANIISQAFKRLGDRYGWAGMYSANDCSGIAREIYACFGFEFPRNGKAQIRMTSMSSQKVSGLSDEEKLEILSELPAGSLLYFPGHLMIYLGTDNGTPYVISAVGSMATADMSEGDSISVNSVIVNSLTDTTRKTGKTWLNCITNILTCEK